MYEVNAFSRLTRREFLHRTHYKYDSGREDMTTLYLVPVAPGVTRAYNKVVVKGVPNTSKKIFNFLAKNLLSSGYFHAFGHGLIDQVLIQIMSQNNNNHSCIMAG